MASQLMLGIREQLLAILYLDLLHLDLTNVILSLLGLQLLLFFLEELLGVSHLVLLIGDFDFDEAVLGAAFLVSLFKALSHDRESLFGLAFLHPQSLLVLESVGHCLLSLLTHPGDLLVLLLLQLENYVLLQLQFAFFFGQFLLLQLYLDHLVFNHLTLLLGQLDFLLLELILTLAERALYDLGDVDGALLDTFKDLSELILLADLLL